MPWATHVEQCRRQWVAKPQGGANPIKRRPSSDWGLQLDPMKEESLVIADQLCRGEYVLELCTRVLCSRVCQPVKIRPRLCRSREMKSQFAIREDPNEGRKYMSHSLNVRKRCHAWTILRVHGEVLCKQCAWHIRDIEMWENGVFGDRRRSCMVFAV